MGDKPIFDRRSIRKFSNENVPKEIVDVIISAGMVAPSAKNRQPWKCVVLGNEHKEEFLACMETGIKREEINAMLPQSKSGLTDAKNTLRIMREAPVLIVILNTNGKSPFVSLNADERFTEICDNLSIGAFIENMLLQAQELGIGTLWIANTCFAYKELISYLDTEFQLIGAIALGYANENPTARPRKIFDDIVEFRM
ncbi:MAG: nitroreductase family protein [Roseburia sp.]|nr:nitroreductase family protein [Roseburia sp.]MCM1279188.1 nitroreductase family protein [Robinsoniella sp.]